MRRSSTVAVKIVLLVTLFCVGLPVGAQGEEEEETPKKWSHEAEVGIVATSGNSNSTTLGVGDKSVRTWGERALLTLDLEFTRVETKPSQIAICTNPAACDPADPLTQFNVTSGPEIVETERYRIAGKYDWKFSKKTFAFALASWFRNRPAGIDNRYIVSLGVGNTWVDSKKLMFKTNYGVSYTNQKDVIPGPGVDQKYVGFIGAWDFKYQFAESSSYTNVAGINWNLEETERWLGVMTNAVTVSMNKRLALRVGLRWDYNSRPPLGSVPLFDTNTSVVGAVLVFKEKLDTTFTTSLVINL